MGIPLGYFGFLRMRRKERFLMDTVKFWAAFAIGVAAGASVALIYAPQSGEKTRKQLRRNFEDASEYVKDAADTLGDHAEKFVRRGRSVVEDLADSANSVAKVANTAAKKVAEMV
jgi:gas vesicle protein